MTRATRSFAWGIAVITIFLAAAFFRLYRLDAAPPGMPIDEIVDAGAVRAIAAGWRPVFIEQGWGREPLYHYIAALLLPLVGDPQMTIRLTSAFIGIALVAAVGAFTAQMASRPAGLLAAAFTAVTYWAVFASRYGVRNILLPLLSTLTAYLFFRAMEGRQWPSGDRDKGAVTGWVNWALAGVLLGLTFYTYQSSRVFPLVFVAVCAWQWLFDRKRLQATWRGILVFFTIGLIVGTPLFAYLLTHPGAESGRAFMLEPLSALQHGDPGPLAASIWRTFLFFSFDAGDWTYNVPGHPVFALITGVLFYLGIIACVIRWRDVRRFTLVAWFLLGLLPVMLTSGPHYMRLIGVLAPGLALPAIGLVDAGDWVSRRTARERPARLSTVILLVVGALALGQSAVVTWRDYFETWAVNPHVRAEHNSDLREIGRYLDQSADTTPVVIASLAAEDVEPDLFGGMLLRADLDQRWFDASTALVLPGGTPAARYIFRPDTPLRGALSGYFSGARLVHDQAWPDGVPSFKVYRLDVVSARESVLARVVDAFAPVRLMDRVELLDYSAPMTVTPGSPLRLLTTWHVLRTATPGPSGVFAHLLDGEGRIVAQDDHLGFPRHSWRADDLFVQFSRLDIPATLPPGRFTLQIGLYDKDTQARWPVTDSAGQALGDHIVLGTVSVQP